MRKSILAILILIVVSPLSAQNTVGVVNYDATKAYEGYNLLFSHNQTNVYLLDNCGRIVHQWQDTIYKPGNTAYILENGNLVRTGSRGVSANPVIGAGGAGEVVMIKDWDDNLLWFFEHSDSLKRLHHDIEVLPGGNILMISWEYKTMSEAITAGRNPALLPDSSVWPEKIIEVKPIGTDSFDIVWEWHAWDHLVQDFDTAKANFGVVADHPELIDLNYDDGAGDADWHHANAIDYNPVLDQIVMSVPAFDEIWVIDHGTTTAEAAGHSGGRYGKGGDLLYRWGNPLAYQRGDTSDQTLSFQHDIRWLNPEADTSDSDFGKLMVFNNRIGATWSAVDIFDSPVDGTGAYSLSTGAAFGPSTYSWRYTAAIPDDMVSPGLSGATRLPNGNTLICSGRQGWVFEVTPSEDIVWEYINPFTNAGLLSQGDSVPSGSNILFRMERYAPSFAGFSGRDLTPGGYVEMLPDTMLCYLATFTDPVAAEQEWKIYPNPAGKCCSG